MNMKLTRVVEGSPIAIPPILEPNLSESQMVNAMYAPPTRKESASLIWNASMGKACPLYPKKVFNGKPKGCNFREQQKKSPVALSLENRQGFPEA
jgi:hypothetical protein